MTKRAFLFPGQGSQHIGMGQELLENSDTAKEYFKTASDIMDRDIAKICLEGPEEALTQTDNAQVGIFLVSIAALDAAKKEGKEAQYLAGHSLGEITALYAAGVLSLEHALKIVIERGRLMNEAAQSQPSGMAAVLGMAATDIAPVLSEVADPTLVIANDNCPGQIVISGASEAVEKAMAALKDAGAKRVIPLKVSGAFHSPIMAPAADKLADYIANIPFESAQIPILLNRTASLETEPAALKENLPLQLKSPVRWTESIQALREEGVAEWEELGPGKVLSGLLKKIIKE